MVSNGLFTPVHLVPGLSSSRKKNKKEPAVYFLHWTVLEHSKHIKNALERIKNTLQQNKTGNFVGNKGENALKRHQKHIKKRTGM